MKKHTRSDLIGGISALQGLVALASNAAANDRNPNRQAHVQDYLKRAFDLCVELGSTHSAYAGMKSKFYNRDKELSKAK